MQISENVYVNIKIQDLDIDNFLQVQDLLDLQIVETAGASLPIIYASFLTAEQKIINHFIRNNTVIVELGESKEDCDSFIVSIYSSTPPNNGAEGTRRLVEFGGFIINQDYMVNLETKTYWGNSMLVAHQVVNSYFGAKPGKGLQTNITRTNENQVVWRQNNETPCLFLAETLVHMDIMPSFPLFTFDKHGTFHLNDFNSVAKSEPVLNFVSGNPQKTNDVQYINNFSIEDFKDMYNIYSGFNKVTEIWGASSGIMQYAKSYNEPILASTQQTDMLQSSSRTLTNTVQSANVHNTYVEAFVYNSNKLVALSSMQGAIELVGKYYRNLKPTDLVSVSTGDADIAIDGLYLVDTIRTQVDMRRGGVLHTYVYVTRDNKNSIENYIANPQRGIKIKKKFWTDLANAVSRLRVAYATGLKIIDGTYMKNVLSFATACKTNLLRSFVVAGVTIDFTSSANLIQSLINTGNSLMNSLLAMIFPDQIAWTFRDFIIRKPSLRALLSNYISQYVPYELQDIVSAIVDALYHTTNSLNYIAKDNGIEVIKEGTTQMPETTSEIDYTSESQKLVNNIITDFENNTSGLNIPFPIIELTESQSLMSEPMLRDYVANQTIANLTNLGYLEGVDTEKLKEILLGEEPIDFNMIDQINKNAGNSYNYRLWGTYNDLTELTSFFVKKGYKDKYRTIPCTKLINATDNIKIFFACPEKETDLRFYINSKRVEIVEDLEGEIKEYYILLDQLHVLEAELKKLIEEGATEEVIKAKEEEVDAKEKEVEAKDYTKKIVFGKFNINLDYTDTYGNLIPYTIYYTNKGFNSTSVLFEVKQGGMV